jgi:hypothetical protein
MIAHARPSVHQVNEKMIVACSSWLGSNRVLLSTGVSVSVGVLKEVLAIFIRVDHVELESWRSST